MRTTQRKGDLATAQAIASFTRMGYDVLIPITESAAYDIVIDTPEGFKAHSSEIFERQESRPEKYTQQF